MSPVTIADTRIRQDDQGRYCLNDLHKAAVAQGSNARAKEPGKFFRSPRVQELVKLLESESDTPNWGITLAPVNALREGPYEERGTYVCLELVVAYGQFVSAAFDLKVIRSFLGGVAAPMIQSYKYWDTARPHWAGIARAAMQGATNKAIALDMGRSASSVGACLRRMYEVGYCNPVAVYVARLKPATAARWAITKPAAAQWGRPAQAQPCQQEQLSLL